MGVEAADKWQSDLASVLLSQEAIQARVAELAREIAADYKGRNPLVVGVLKGSVVFLADLIRALSFPLEMDLICVSSYGDSATSSGNLRVLKDLAVDIRDRDVLLVEDIIDTGTTICHLAALLEERGPRSVKIVTLLSKPARRKVECEPDYLGFEIPDEFVVGYGLDFAERYRWLPYVAVLRPEAYQ